MTIFPSSNERLITVSIFAFIFGVILGLALVNGKVDFSTLISAVTTLLAAYFGARFAFKLQSQREDRVRIKEEVTAGNRAIFEIIRTYNKFCAVRSQFIDPFRSHPLKHYFILPASGLDHHKTYFDYDSLSFILDSKDPNILTSLASYELEANSTVEAINHRSKLHFEVVQPAIEEAAKKHGEKMTEEQIDIGVGIRNRQLIAMATDSMIECVDDVIQASESQIAKLNELLKDKYKGHGVLKMEILNKMPKKGAGK